VRKARIMGWCYVSLRSEACCVECSGVHFVSLLGYVDAT
jgi:hypothetical protein